jgi:hypothetical protein
MALETLTLGVQGKLALWKALKQITGVHPALAGPRLDDLIRRAQAQHDALERERLTSAPTVFTRVETD